MIARPPPAVPLLALTGFLALLGLVLGDWAPLVRVDTALSEGFRAFGATRPGLIDGLRLATEVAATIPYVSAGVAAYLLLRRGGQRQPALFCAVLTPLVPALWLLMHQLLHRPRPRDGFILVTTNGFPSGHATMATAAALAAVLLLWPRLARIARVVSVGLAAAFAVFIGLTRVALLAHWPTDVLGGWLLALAVVSGLARLVGTGTGSAPPSRPDPPTSPDR